MVRLVLFATALLVSSGALANPCVLEYVAGSNPKL
jgi:hypothetical protein